MENYNIETEVWKDIKGFNGYYKVSDRGNVLSVRFNRIMKPEITKKGYARIGLTINNSKDKRYVHRLVAEAFITNPKRKKEVNHIDGNKLNNFVNNLGWVTSKENSIHYIKGYGDIDYENDTINSTDENVIRYLYNRTDCSHKDLALIFNVSTSTIYNLIKK